MFCAFYVLPPPNSAFVCCVVGMSLREGWGGEGSTCRRAGCGEARGPSGSAGSWRVPVHSTRRLLCFAAVRAAGCHRQHSQLAQGAGTRSVRGASAFASQPELGSGWEGLHKRSRRALREALLSQTHHSSSPGLICLFRLGCLQQHIISVNYGVSWETCRIPCKPFEFFISKEGETQRHFTLLMQLHIHRSPLNADVCLQQML